MTLRKPAVLFVCVHNAGRSQMAAGWLAHLAGDRINVRSAGSEPANRINPVAVAAMTEVGIDITAAQPQILTADDVNRADVVITMGCGDACPVFPGKRYEDWDLADPAGQPIEIVRRIRDAIRDQIATLVSELVPAAPSNSPARRSITGIGAVTEPLVDRDADRLEQPEDQPGSGPAPT